MLTTLVLNIASSATIVIIHRSTQEPNAKA